MSFMNIFFGEKAAATTTTTTTTTTTAAAGTSRGATPAPTKEQLAVKNALELKASYENSLRAAEKKAEDSKNLVREFVAKGDMVRAKTAHETHQTSLRNANTLQAKLNDIQAQMAMLSSTKDAVTHIQASKQLGSIASELVGSVDASDFREVRSDMMRTSNAVSSIEELIATPLDTASITMTRKEVQAKSEADFEAFVKQATAAQIVTRAAATTEPRQAPPAIPEAEAEAAAANPEMFDFETQMATAPAAPTHTVARPVSSGSLDSEAQKKKVNALAQKMRAQAQGTKK